MSVKLNAEYVDQLNLVCKSNSLWLLQAQDGLFAMIEDNNNNQYIPVWSEKDRAERYINNDWEEYEAVDMDFKEFFKWINELDEDRIFIGAFPDDNFKVIPLGPKEFRDHLQQKLIELN